MINRKPEGYKELLAYQKAATLQEKTLELVALFPKSKTMIDLADQMARSARSGTKNIVEGWKRNTTKEYFTFLGFSVGSIEELKDDAADISKGLYKDLMGIEGLWVSSERKIKGLRGEMGEKGKNGNETRPLTPLKPFTPLQLDKLKFYPLDKNLPPIIQLYLQAKEVLMLLNRLQLSLDQKMNNSLAISRGERLQAGLDKIRKDDEWIKRQREMLKKK